jgi:hypothetical protein
VVKKFETKTFQTFFLPPATFDQPQLKKKVEKPKVSLRPFFIGGEKNSQKKIPNFLWLPPTFEQAKMLGFH